MTAPSIILVEDGPSLRTLTARASGEWIRGAHRVVRLDPARSRNTSGFGLGIPIAARIAEEAGSALTLANRAGGGLTATMTLPTS